MNTIIKRQLIPDIQIQLARGKSILLLGPRQVAKATATQSIKMD